MKKINLFTKVCLFAAMMFMAAACTEDEPAVAPIFPEGETTLNVKAGDKTEVSFTANVDWELSSSALWCVFSNGKMRINGTAGEQKLELSINADMLTFEESVADITLKMGDESKIIAKVYRAPMEYEVSVLLKEGEIVCSEDKPAQILYAQVQKETAVIVNANFDWKLEFCPDWLVIDEQLMQGKAGEETYITMKLNAQSVVEPKSESIKILDKSGVQRGVIYVSYEGMPEGAIEFSVERPWAGFTFSVDGKKYSTGSLTSGDVDMIDAPLEITVYDNIDEDLLPYYLRYDDYGMSDFDPWMNKNWGNATIENNVIKFSAEPNTGGERQLALLLLPKSIYENASADFLTEKDKDGAFSLKEDYEKYLVTIVKQATQPLEITVKAWSSNVESELDSYLPSEKGIDNETATGLCGGCDINNVKVIVLKQGVAYEKVEIKIDALQEGMWQISSPTLWVDKNENSVKVNPSDTDPKTIVLSNIVKEMPYEDPQEMIIPISSLTMGWPMPYAGIIIIRE